MTPNYLRAPGISVSPWCDCSNSGNGKAECDKFTELFTNNRCLREWTSFTAAATLYHWLRGVMLRLTEFAHQH